MGALQRHEAEQHCIDMKKTFFACSLDGDSAFEVVDRQILTRDTWQVREVTTGEPVTTPIRTLSPELK